MLESMLKNDAFSYKTLRSYTVDQLIDAVKRGGERNATVISVLKYCIGEGSYRIDKQGTAMFIDGERYI